MIYNMRINSTGPWTACSYLDTAKFATGEKGNVFVSASDRKVLKQLAERVANLAHDTSQIVKIKLWKDHNALRTKQTVIFCDPENGWNDIITEDMLKCCGNLAKRWELILRKELFWGEKIKDDKPIEPFFNIGYTYTEEDWAGETNLIKGGKDGGSYVWEAPIKNPVDIKKIRIPKLEIDYITTEETIELAKDVFKGLLQVRLKGLWWWSFGFTLNLVKLIGLNEMMLSFYDNPELIHEVNRKINEGYLHKIKYLEKNNLLSLNNDGTYIGSGGLGYSDELPAESFDGSHVRPIDMWVLSESQESSAVSPDFFEEFIFSYQLPILKQFNLVCYGCCEPLDHRWNVIKKIPNLRKVSVSHWANNKNMAENLQDKYIYSMKPTPADLAVDKLDEEYIRKKMIKEIEVTKGCVVEIIMKDNHTLGKNPQNLISWVKIMREVIDKVYS